MSLLTRELKKLDKSRRKVQNVIVGGVADGARSVIDIGRKMAGLPKGGSAQGCASKTSRKGKSGRHYTWSPRVTVAAGAKTAGTSIGDFMLAANSLEVTQDNYFPWDFDIDTAQLVVGVNLNAAAAVENAAAILGSCVLVIQEQGTNETTRVPLLKFNPIYDVISSATAASVGASTTQLKYEPVEFELDLNDGDETHMDIHISKDVTTVNVVEFTMIFEGTRSKKS